MKKHEIHTLSKTAGFSSMKNELTQEVEHFLDAKVVEGYEIVNVSFTYY
jgi:flagellar basal body-associated protein FliL